LQPERAIVVDEALTSGTEYWARSADAPQFSHLTLTGGAIGFGMPAAVGAAVACPDRRVVLLQADGSGMYSAPALWTMARENLDVVTIICHNDRYAILQLEQAVQRCTSGGAASKSLTDLGSPSIDWVSLAKGLGLLHAERVDTVGELISALNAALERRGPTLIEAMLP
jgi:acetolactate synthase-1/2/3 large subunit